MEAAVSAAVADGVIPTGGGGVKNEEEGSLPSSSNAVEGLLAVAAAQQQQQQQLPPMSAMINLNQLLGNSLLNTPLAGAINPSLMAVAAAAAQSNLGLVASAASTQEPKVLLRRGKWTAEEEAYANRLIQEFKAGLLPLTDGTTLRTFLSKLLNCDPMRISKKFVGSNCIGKQVFRRRGADVNNLTPDEIERTRCELSELEKKFLDRVAHSKNSSKGGGDHSTSKSAAKAAASLGYMSSSDGGGGGGNGGNNNKSAAAVGRALLQGNKAPQASMDVPGGLLAQLKAENPGMFDHSLQQSSFMSNASLGKIRSCLNYIYLALHRYSLTHQHLFYSHLGNMSANSITNLLLQAGISRNQISMLTNKGMSLSTSLANMLGKNGSFDQLMSLDFQSMQSIDNIANLIQGNARLPTAQMKNMEWGNQWGGGGNGAPSFNNGAGGNNKRSIDNLVKALSGGLGDSNNNAVNNANNLANSTNFSNFIQATKQGNNNLAGAPTNDIAKYIQSLTQQQQQQQNQQQVNNMNYSNILQNMASGNMNRNVNQNMGGNDLLSMLNQSSPQSMNNFPQQQQNFNPFMQQLGLNQNPMMQLLAQGGGCNNMANLFAQSNGFNGLGGGMNNNIPLGQFGQGLGGNNFNNFGSNFIPAGNQQNTVALIQQLIAAQQQSYVGGANNNQTGAPDVGAMNNQTEAPNVAQGDNNVTSGTKRSLDDVNDRGDGDNGGPTKKQMTAL